MEMYATTKDNIIKILYVLKEAKGSPLYISYMARHLKLHRFTISRLINLYFKDFIDDQTVGNMRFITLKDPTLTLEQILKTKELRKQLRDI
jgi:hypothetical protein